MSSKRGRKRNDNLPPNRARDVQRAFRARRAAHLQALEQRVAELEEENSCLRQALDLPPSNRPPLGRGPTGKDRPKNYENNSVPSSSTQSFPFTLTGREPSTTGSPDSRTSSRSPQTINVSMSSLSTRPMQVIDAGSSWSINTFDGHQSDVQVPTNPSHQHTPMPAPLSLKPPYPAHVNSSLPPSSPNSMSSDAYVPTGSVCSHSSDRPLSQSYGGQDFTLRYPALRDELLRQYSYTPTPPQTHHYTGIHSRSPSSATPMHLHRHQQPQHLREPTVTYTPASQRRSTTDSHGFSTTQNFSHLSHIQLHQQLHHQPPPLHHPVRHIEFMRSQDNMGHLTPPPGNHLYDPDGHLNHHHIP